MTKFFHFMDHLPIVRILQVFAVIYFISAFTMQLYYHFTVYDFTVTTNGDLDQEWNLFLSWLIALVRSIFTQTSNALILLGLAEIIKLMKEKKND